MKSGLVSAFVLAGSFLPLLVLENLSPLRRAVEPKLRRTTRNLTTAGVSLAIMTLVQTPLLLPVSAWVSAHRIGLLHAVEWPRGVEVALAVLLLDYTLWFWHWANHVVPFFWRFHLVHHVDRDLDASTALRFHFGELFLSIGYRALQIAAIGADPFSVFLWQTILFASILFHHSNLRLPLALERLLVRLVVTPRMHGIHHSDRRDETNSNYSSLLSVWDLLHRTLVLGVPQAEIRIGVAAYRDARDVTLGKILLLPFVTQRADWVAPDGSPSVVRRGGATLAG